DFVVASTELGIAVVIVVVRDADMITYKLQFDHFVLEEDMLEVDCPCVTPEVVLKASGHVDKFTDLMVKDEKTGTCYRADHLLKDYCKDTLEKDLSISSEKAAELKHILAVLDDLSAEQLGAKIKEYGIVARDTKNPLSDPYPFNLMFATSIGPSGMSPGLVMFLIIFYCMGTLVAG
nr:glycine--tRNA ligase, mitochondrial 1-like [Tanacetum cinerariifolium]